MADKKLPSAQDLQHAQKLLAHHQATHAALTGAIGQTSENGLLKGLHEAIDGLNADTAWLKDQMTRADPSIVEKMTAQWSHAKVAAAGVLSRQAALAAALNQLENSVEACELIAQDESISSSLRSFCQQAGTRHRSLLVALRKQNTHQNAHQAERKKDDDSITMGRAMPRVDAEAPTIKQSSDY